MRRKLHYAWIVAATTFLILLVAAGVRSVPSILILPLKNEFGWSTATISAAIGVNIFLFGMMGPFAVAIMERFGLRRAVCSSLVILSISVALTSLMKKPWQMMLLWGVMVGLGSGMLALVLGATVTGRWFKKHRGLVMGALTASNATGQLLFLPMLASLSTHSGWRSVSLTVAAIALIAVPMVALFLRDRPSDLGLPPYGETEIQPTIPSAINPAVRALQALRVGLASRDFYLLAGSFFICGASTNGLIGTHLVPACCDHGIPEVQAAGLLALMGVFDLIGTTASGWLSDRFDSRKLLFVYYGLRGLSLFFLPYSFDFKFHGLSLFAIFYGLDWIATVPPTLKLAGKAFGEANAALMFGWIVAVHQVGAALAAWVAGLIRTETGHYDKAFFLAGFLCIFTALMVLFISRDKRKAPASIAVEMAVNT
jgi:predicted MFS family arabinose efflux permease